MATYTSQHHGRWTDPAVWAATNRIGSAYYSAIDQWASGGGALNNISVIANQEYDPYSNTLTADKIIENNTAGVQHSANKWLTGTTAGVIMHCVALIKSAPSGRTWVYLQYTGKDAVISRAWFDLANGVVGSKDVGIASSYISSEGNGWYRCEIVMSSTGTGSTVPVLALGLSTGDSIYNYNGDGTSSIYACLVTAYETDLIFPNTTADVINTTASSGHLILYDQSSTIQYGNITINTGTTFKFSRTMSTKLMNDAASTLSVFGTLDMGRLSDPIPNQYTVEYYKPGSTDGANTNNVIRLRNGCYIYCCGDPATYGGLWKTWLNDNVVSDGVTATTITVPVDVSTKWKSGQELVIHNGNNYVNLATDGGYFTISGSPVWDGSKSTITLTTSLPSGTWSSGGLVCNTARNVKIGKDGATRTWGAANSPRPPVLCSNSATDVFSGMEIDSIEIIAPYAVGGYVNGALAMGLKTSNCSIRNGAYVFAWNIGATSSNDIITSMLNATYRCNSTLLDSIMIGLTNSVISLPAGLNILGSNSVTCGSLYILNGGNSVSIESGARVFSNSYLAIYGGTCTIKSGAIINKNMANITANHTYTFLIEDTDVTSYGTFPTEPSLGPNRITNRSYMYPIPQIRGKIRIVGWNGDPNTMYTAFGLGRADRDTSVLYPGMDSSIKLAPGLNLIDNEYIAILDTWSEYNVPTTQQIRSVKIRGYGWSVFPTNTQLYLEVEYLNALSGMTTAKVASTAVLTDNTSWVDFPVTFVPGQVGIVKYKLYIKLYSSGCGIYVAPILFRDGLSPIKAIWSDAETHLKAQYDQSTKKDHFAINRTRRIYG